MALHPSLTFLSFSLFNFMGFVGSKKKDIRLSNCNGKTTKKKLLGENSRFRDSYSQFQLAKTKRRSDNQQLLSEKKKFEKSGQ